MFFTHQKQNICGWVDKATEMKMESLTMVLSGKYTLNLEYVVIVRVSTSQEWANDFFLLTDCWTKWNCYDTMCSIRIESYKYSFIVQGSNVSCIIYQFAKQDYEKLRSFLLSVQNQRRIMICVEYGSFASQFKQRDNKDCCKLRVKTRKHCGRMCTICFGGSWGVGWIY